MTNDRMMRFNHLKNHPWLGRVYKRLSMKEVDLCQAFLIQNANLDKNQFITTVNRMFVDQVVKPKNWPVIMELLTCCA